MSAPLTVVLGDFDRGRSDATQAALTDRGFSVIRCETGAEILEQCEGAAPAAAVLEVFMPRKNGFEVLKALKEDSRTGGVKVLLMVDEDDDYGEHRARLCGADGIQRRPAEPAGIALAVHNMLQEDSLEAAEGAAQMEGGLESMLDTMEGRVRSENPLHEHITDPLTGLNNEAYMSLKLAEEFKKARRFGLALSCVAVGFDDDAAGSGEDTQELRTTLNVVAGILLCESRDIDHIARKNVSEFFLLLPHTDGEGALAMSKRILKSVEGRGFQSADGPTLTASAGIATYTGSDAEEASELETRSHQALNAARRWGGNRVTTWSQDATAASQS